jgi:hypothetical protein
MADQDAQDINQMMSATSDVVIGKPKKSMFIWVVLGCVVVGVGLGVVVYQQSVKTIIKPSPTPKVAVIATPKPSLLASPIPTPVTPETNLITEVPNVITFPESGKIRVFNDLNNIQLVITLTIAGTKKTLTIPNKTLNAATPMTFADSTFDVTAGSTASVSANLNSAAGPKMGGWIIPAAGEICGANTGGKTNASTKLAFALTKLASGATPYAKQCWADDIDPKDPSSYDFNDFYMVWGYVPGSIVSPSPSATSSTAASPSPSASVRASASPSVSASSTATPTPSPRVVMPDTSEGTPVTGIFEVTVGTVSVGLLLLILGLFGLLAL